MYLRTTRRKNADGSVVEYYQLAENVWNAEKGCAVAKVVYNFGRADQLDRSALQRLAKSILRVFPGEEAIAAEPGVRIRNAWPYGAIHAVDAIWRELGIDKVIADLTRRHGTRQPFERALLAMVANRTHGRTPSSTAGSNGSGKRCSSPARRRSSWSTSTARWTSSRRTRSRWRRRSSSAPPTS